MILPHARKQMEEMLTMEAFDQNSSIQGEKLTQQKNNNISRKTAIKSLLGSDLTTQWE